MSQHQRYCFIAECFDSMASLVRQYQLFYYPEDKSIEIYDIKNRKIFLKRIINPQVSIKDIFLNAELNIYSRKLKVIEYGDDYTKTKFIQQRSSTFALIKPEGYLNIGKIIDIISKSNFTIMKMKMLKLTPGEAQSLLSIEQNQASNEEIQYISSDLVVGLELSKQNAFEEFKKIVGPSDYTKAKNEAPYSLRSLFNANGRDCIHISDTINHSDDQMNYFFSIKHQPQLTNCSCIVIKPHIVFDGDAGKLIDIILSSGFEISSMQLFYLDKSTAEEFLDVYKGVLPEYAAIIEHLSSGPSIALEVRQEDVVNKLRALIGPHDPDIAKHLRPNTIRAIFGKDRVKNVVHCTDLPEDGVLESQFFFELID